MPHKFNLDLALNPERAKFEPVSWDDDHPPLLLQKDNLAMPDTASFAISDTITQRLKQANVRYWAGDNISEHITDQEKELLVELTF